MEYPTRHLYFLGIHTSLVFRNLGRKIYAMHDGKVELNTVEYATAFLNSDWLYFLWHEENIFPSPSLPNMLIYQLITYGINCLLMS